MAVTIYDIAAMAGVSHTTVSAVLNERTKQARIGPATVSKVLSVAKQLGYERNALAHAIVSGKTRIVAIITSEPEKEFIGRFLHGALAEASDRGYLLHLQSVSDFTHLSLITALERSASYRPIGLYLCALDDVMIDREATSRLANLVQTGVPVVHSHCLGGWPGTAVDSDDIQGAKLATDHLLLLGHRHIAFLGGKTGQRSSEERLQGFREGLAEAGLVAHGIKHTDWSWTAATMQARELLKRHRRPSAILCASDIIAAAALQVARDLGLNVPGDLSLIGFSNQEVGRSVAPHLTTVDQPHQEIGRQAVASILNVTEGKIAVKLLKNRRLPTQLKIRDSTSVLKNRSETGITRGVADQLKC